MKHILVTGTSSYIGNSFADYVQQWHDEYQIEKISLRDGCWREKSLSDYNVIYHVAGIVHQKEKKENAHLYYEINRDLTVELAKKANADGVKQFIFLSSGSIYGRDTGVITPDTEVVPKTDYGKSKLEAEEAILPMSTDDFKIAIVRPLMVYGKGCKGNFKTVIKLVQKLPVFPNIHNERSLIYIDNLSEFIKLIIDKNASGVFFPQNREYADTREMASLIAKCLGKKLYMSRLLGAGVFLIRNLTSATKKAFGSKVYKDTEQFDYQYCVCGFEESIRKSI